MTAVYYTASPHDSKNYSDIARLLLGYGLMQSHGITDAVILKDKRGKPYIDGHPDIHVSITHTNGCVACAVSDSPVGIDAECAGDIRQRVTQKMFTENERDYAGNSPERFFEIWTKKESYVKMTGDGLTHTASTIDTITGDGTNGAAFTHLRIPGVTVCVCTSCPESVTVHDLTNTEIKGISL